MHSNIFKKLLGYYEKATSMITFASRCSESFELK
jgi:hypothetical protein